MIDLFVDRFMEGLLSDRINQTFPFTQLRKMILEILLLEGANDETEDVLLLAMDHGNKKASELLINRESGGREQGSLTFPSSKPAFCR